MPTTAEIIQAMQFNAFFVNNPINVTGNAARVISYQFADAEPGDWVAGSWSTFRGWTGLSGREQKAVRKMLAHVETFLNVDFVEVAGQADPDLNIGKANLPKGVAGKGGYYVTYPVGDPPKTFTTWDGFSIWDKDINIARGSQALILHELGHALGLKHPFDVPVLPDKVENNHYTLMSYTADPTHPGPNKAMMLYDILALQDIWGAAAANPGDDVYAGPRIAGSVDVIWDSGGTDTLDASADTDGARLDLGAGRFSRFGDFADVAIAYNVTIENARGGRGNDVLAGNGIDNVLSGGKGGDRLAAKGGNDTLNGNAGADTLKGGAGDDVLRGGTGNDRLVGQAGADTFVYGAGDGRDRIADFAAGDVLQVSGLGDRADILARADEGGGDVRFDFGGGNVLILENVTLATIDAGLVAV